MPVGNGRVSDLGKPPVDQGRLLSSCRVIPTQLRPADISRSSNWQSGSLRVGSSPLFRNRVFVERFCAFAVGSLVDLYRSAVGVLEHTIRHPHGRTWCSSNTIAPKALSDAPVRSREGT